MSDVIRGDIKHEYPTETEVLRKKHEQLLDFQRKLNAANAEVDALKKANAASKVIDDKIKTVVTPLANAVRKMGDESAAAEDVVIARDAANMLDELRTNGLQQNWPHDYNGGQCWCGSRGLHGGQPR